MDPVATTSRPSSVVIGFVEEAHVDAELLRVLGRERRLLACHADARACAWRRCRPRRCSSAVTGGVDLQAGPVGLDVRALAVGRERGVARRALDLRRDRLQQRREALGVDRQRDVATCGRGPQQRRELLRRQPADALALEPQRDRTRPAAAAPAAVAAFAASVVMCRLPLPDRHVDRRLAGERRRGRSCAASWACRRRSPARASITRAEPSDFTTRRASRGLACRLASCSGRKLELEIWSGGSICVDHRCGSSRASRRPLDIRLGERRDRGRCRCRSSWARRDRAGRRADLHGPARACRRSARASSVARLGLRHAADVDAADGHAGLDHVARHPCVGAQPDDQQRPPAAEPRIAVCRSHGRRRVP